MRGDLDQLRVLVAVAECGSFTAAAAERNTEVSAVSRSIQELEAIIGVSLFDRLPRGVRLTAAGQSYVASARDILEKYESARHKAFRAGSGRDLHLDLGFVWSVASTPMVELLRMFTADHPFVTVAVLEAGNDDLIARVRSRRLDVAIAAADPVGLPRLKPVEGLSILPLWLEPLADVVQESAPLKVATWDDLALARMLCRTVDDWPRFVRHVERLGGPTLTFEPQSVSFEGVLGLVAAGLGWTIIPASLSHLLPSGIRAVPISSTGAELQVEAVWRPENANQALTRFLALCRQLYGPAPDGAPLRSPDPSP